MTKIKSDYRCPKCNKKNRFKIYQEISETNIPKVLDRSLFTFSCNECHEQIIIDYPFLIKNKDYIIYYTPSSNKLIKDESTYMIKRVCDTYTDLKEKVLILEDDLDDIIIEFIKVFLIEELDKDIKDEVTDIRYDSKDNKQLIFHLFGINKNISCSIEFYEEIKRRSRCKKIKDAVLIDNKTFTKYFKMR